MRRGVLCFGVSVGGVALMFACTGSPRSDATSSQRLGAAPKTPSPPALSNPFPLDQPLLEPEVLAGPSGACVGSSPLGYLVARSGADGRVVRVSPEGTVLDPLGIVVAPWGATCAVASDGNDWLVAWQPGPVLYTLMSPDAGVLVDLGLIASNGNYLEAPSAASNGPEFLVVWPTTFPNSIQGARISVDAGVLDPGGFVIFDGGERPAVASDGSEFLVVWEALSGNDYSQVCVSRVDASGNVLDDPPLVLPGACSTLAPSVVWDGQEFIVVWSQCGADVFGWRIDADGGFVDAAPVDLQLSGAPQAASDGVRTTIVAVDFDNNFDSATWAGAQWLGDGTVVAAGALYHSVYNPWDLAPLAALPEQALLLISEDIPTAPGVASGPTLLGFPLSTAPTLDAGAPIYLQERYDQEQQAALASTPDGTFIEWMDDRDLQELSFTHGMFVQAGAWPPDASIMQLQAPVFFSGNTPRVATDGTDFLAAWQEHTYILVEPINGATGEPSAAPVSVSKAGDFSVAFGAGEYVVAQAIPGNPEVGVSRVTPAGVIVDASPVSLSTAGSPANAAVVFGLDRFFVAWQQDSPQNINAAFFWPDGGTDPRGAFPVSCAQSDQSMPVMATDGTRVLVVWLDDRTGLTQTWGAFLDTSSGPPPPDSGVCLQTDAGYSASDAGFLLMGVGANQSWPSLSFDGTNYVLGWIDARTGLAQAYVSRVSPGGAPLDATGIQMSASDSGVDTLGLGNTGPGQTLVLFSDVSVPLLVDRLSGRFLSESACAGAADCTAAPVCHVGVCSALTGACAYPSATDGTPCDAGFCQTGSCVTADAGPGVDAGAGGVDAGMSDGGSVGQPDSGEADAGASDSGSAPPLGDAGGSATRSQGCGCTSGAGPLTSACLLLVAFVRRSKGRRASRLARQVERGP